MIYLYGATQLLTHNHLFNDLSDYLQSMSGNFERSNFESTNLNEPSPASTMAAIAKLPEQHQAAVVGALKSVATKAPAGLVSHIGVASSSDVNRLIQESIGDLNLSITRVGVNVDSVLPFILFGANDSVAKYASTIKQFLTVLPAGTTLAVTTDNNGNIVFSYTLADATDTVTVSNLGNNNYQSFIASMQSKWFATKYMLLSITQPDFSQLQFAQPIFYGKLSSLGMTGANQLILRSRTQSWMFRPGIIEVIMPEQIISPDFSFAMYIIPVNNFQIGFDIFMSRSVQAGQL